MPNANTIVEVEKHRVQTGETLQSLARANGLTWQELAKFNWGTDVPAQINDRLRDDVGCTRRDSSGNYIFDNADEPGIVMVPKKFEVGGLAIDRTHTLRVLPVSPPKSLYECVCIPGFTFEFDKSFIRSSVVDSMRKLDDALTRYPDAKLIVFGHTDRVGGEQYNKELSERRAKSAYAFITDQPDIWEQLFNQENWGLKPIQEILKDLGHDPGPIDGINGDQTKAAVREFQNANALAVDSVAGPQTRRKLFLNYMTGMHNVRVTDEQFAPPKFMGCGEFNPAVELNGNELANGGRGRAPGNEPNRRVVFYLFERPPRDIPCRYNDLGPCQTECARNPGQRKNRNYESTDPNPNPPFSCSFYDRIATHCPCEAGSALTGSKIAIDFHYQLEQACTKCDTVTLSTDDDNGTGYSCTYSLTDTAHVEEIEHHYLRVTFENILQNRPYSLKIESGDPDTTYLAFKHVMLPPNAEHAQIKDGVDFSGGHSLESTPINAMNQPELHAELQALVFGGGMPPDEQTIA